MLKNYTFDNVARSERYFTSLILPHLLMNSDYLILKTLFTELFKIDFTSLQNPEIEVVCELDPLRDGSVYNQDVKTLYREHKRIAVPDLFLRINDVVLIIEAKFFTQPADEELHEQVNMQVNAIDRVLQHTKYKTCKINYCLLTTLAVNNQQNTNSIIYLTWDGIVEIIDKTLKSLSGDILYSVNILKNSIIRAKKELEKTELIRYKRFSFNELIKNLPALIETGEIFVGFVGGERQLLETSLDELVNRSHYKVSSESSNDNWITIDRIIKKYLELKYLIE